MTVKSLARLDTSESLPVGVIREQAGLPPLFGEVSANYDLKPDWWWEERFARITGELRGEIETENLERLSADITAHGVNPSSVELDDEDLAPVEVAAMPEYVAPAVAGQRYDEEHGGWYYGEDPATLAIGTPEEHATHRFMREVPEAAGEPDRPSRWRRFWSAFAELVKSYR